MISRQKICSYDRKCVTLPLKECRQHEPMNKLTYILVGIALLLACQEKEEDVVAQPSSFFERAIAYDRAWKYHLAGYYYQRAFDEYKEPVKNWKNYFETGYRLAIMKYRMQDFNEALRLTTSLAAKGDSLLKSGDKHFPYDTHAFTLAFIAHCQIELNHTDEAKNNCKRAYEVLTMSNTDYTENKMILCASNTDEYIEMNDYDEAERWNNRAYEALAHIEKKLANGNNKDVDLAMEYRKTLSLNKAIILQRKGRIEEANREYDKVSDSNLLQHPNNLEAQLVFLKGAKRYKEALAVMDILDSIDALSKRPRITFENIRDRMIPRYEANMEAGLTNNALVAASNICIAIDSAIRAQQRSDIAELTILYETQQKDEALAESKHNARIHFIIIIALMIMFITASTAYWRVTLSKRKLREKNRQLFETIQQMERKEEKAEVNVLNNNDTSNCSASHLLYRNIVALMREKRPYTDNILNREMLAQMLGTNYSYVADAIKECADGMTIGEYVDDWRIRHAAQMLASTDEPVGLIADLSGFNSRSHFNTLFRQKYMMAPSEYRKIAKEETAV